MRTPEQTAERMYHWKYYIDDTPNREARLAELRRHRALSEKQASEDYAKDTKFFKDIEDRLALKRLKAANRKWWHLW
jgi:hypothetical protein